MASDAAEEWVDHRGVADDDGDEGFAAGPAAGLLSAIGTGLYGLKLDELLTVDSEIKRYIP